MKIISTTKIETSSKEPVKTIITEVIKCDFCQKSFEAEEELIHFNCNAIEAKVKKNVYNENNLTSNGTLISSSECKFNPGEEIINFYNNDFHLTCFLTIINNLSLLTESKIEQMEVFKNHSLNKD